LFPCLSILYHSNGEIAWNIEDIICPSINRTVKIAEHKDDYPVSRDVSAGLEITSNHCILQVKSPPLFIRSKWRC
jgi:hypothetical protein